ncbi:MAG: tRNA pseudouridine(55) synthase TruB [Rhodobacteraceae bacterium]|nr:tRNA pseudouridine(55) synthase TruB [Paracoccaceae bacterium]
MGRRRGGEGGEVAGWLVVDKPSGITSTAVVNRARRALGAARAGHAGTLDPAATGVLAIAFGEATKTIPHLAGCLKTYRFRVRWGAATTTDDAEGEVLLTSPDRPGAAAIAAALPAFRGDILQVPPQVSAVHVAGARAYDLARAGTPVDLAPRPLHVARLELGGGPDADHADFEMVCGKGGYVRAVARDLGRVLGCFGHVAALRRLAAGPFRAEDGVSLVTLEAEAGTPALAARLLPLEAGLALLPQVRATAAGVARLRQGAPGAILAHDLAPGTLAWASDGGRAVAVGRCLGGELRPERVFAA